MIWTYEAPSFKSMVAISDIPNDWAVFLDWSEALCYALLTAQITGIKRRVHKSTINPEAWLVYDIGIIAHVAPILKT